MKRNRRIVEFSDKNVIIMKREFIELLSKFRCVLCKKLSQQQPLTTVCCTATVCYSCFKQWCESGHCYCCSCSVAFKRGQTLCVHNESLGLLLQALYDETASVKMRQLLQQNEQQLRNTESYIQQQREQAQKVFGRKRRYNIIYMDPPWQYTTAAMRGGTAPHYSTLSITDLRRYPILGLAHEDCVLLMWVVWPMLEQALELMRGWGFRYSTNYVSWVKLTKDGNLHTGTGNYTRANTEILIMGIRGQIPKYFQKTSFVNVLLSARRRHSEKPSEIKRMIEIMLGELPRIDLFSRDIFRLGWECWGNEAASTESIDSTTYKLHQQLLKKQDENAALAHETVRGPPGALYRKRRRQKEEAVANTVKKSRVFSQKLTLLHTPACLKN